MSSAAMSAIPIISNGVSKDYVTKGKSYNKSFDEREHVYMCESSPMMKSIPEKLHRSVVHYDEMGKFISIVQFLTNYWNGEIAVCYITKLSKWMHLLSTLFPQIEFVVTGYGTNTKRVSYTIDPLSALTEHSRYLVTDMDMSRDEMLKYKARNVLITIRPDEFAETFFEGRIYYSPFATPNMRGSSKVCIACPEGLPMTEYSTDIYALKLAYHNNVIRSTMHCSFDNLFTNEPGNYDVLSVIGLYNDWDSTCTVYILKNYLDKVDVVTEDKMAQIVFALCESLDITKLGERKNARIEVRRAHR